MAVRNTSLFYDVTIVIQQIRMYLRYDVRIHTYIHTDTARVQHVNVRLAQACPNKRSIRSQKRTCCPTWEFEIAMYIITKQFRYKCYIYITCNSEAPLALFLSKKKRGSNFYTSAYAYCVMAIGTMPQSISISCHAAVSGETSWVFNKLIVRLLECLTN